MVEHKRSDTQTEDFGQSGNIARLVDPSLDDATYIKCVSDIIFVTSNAISQAIVEADPDGRPYCSHQTKGHDEFWKNQLGQQETLRLAELSLERCGVTVGAPLTIRTPGIEEESEEQNPDVRTLDCQLISIPFAEGVLHPQAILICVNLVPQDQLVGMLDLLTSLMLTATTRKNQQESNELYGQLEGREDDFKNLENRLEDSTETLQLAGQIAGVNDLEKLAYELSNLLKSYFGAEKVSLLSKTGKKWKLLSISGQANFDPRSNAVKAAEKLASGLAQIDTRVKFAGQLEDFSESLRPTIERFLQETFAVGFSLFPIVKTSAPVFPADEERLVEMVNPGRTDMAELTGCVIVEQLTDVESGDSLRQKWDMVDAVVSGPFNSAKQHSESFFRPVVDRLNKFAALYRGHTKRKAIGITLAILGPLVLASLIPATFRIRCEGYLQPQNQVNIYAPREAVVKDIFFKEGDIVKQGNTLVRFEAMQIQSELAREEGTLSEMETRQSAIDYQLVFHDAQSPESIDDDTNLLSEKYSELGAQIQSQKNIVTNLRSAADELIVKAPVEGMIMGWNLDRKLRNRPVERGMKLFSIHPKEAGYELDLKVVDKRSGYVQEAAKAKGEDLEIEFSFASYPNDVYHAKITDVLPGLESDDDLGYVLPVIAIPDSELPTNIRAGLPVVAKINCGKRSFLYCKTFEFLDWIQRTSFDYFY